MGLVVGGMHDCISVNLLLGKKRSRCDLRMVLHQELDITSINSCVLRWIASNVLTWEKNKAALFWGSHIS